MHELVAKIFSILFGCSLIRSSTQEVGFDWSILVTRWWFIRLIGAPLFFYYTDNSYWNIHSIQGILVQCVLIQKCEDGFCCSMFLYLILKEKKSFSVTLLYRTDEQTLSIQFDTYSMFWCLMLVAENHSVEVPRVPGIYSTWTERSTDQPSQKRLPRPAS